MSLANLLAQIGAATAEVAESADRRLDASDSGEAPAAPSPPPPPPPSEAQPNIRDFSTHAAYASALTAYISASLGAGDDDADSPSEDEEADGHDDADDFGADAHEVARVGEEDEEDFAIPVCNDDASLGADWIVIFGANRDSEEAQVAAVGCGALAYSAAAAPLATLPLHHALASGADVCSAALRRASAPMFAMPHGVRSSSVAASNDRSAETAAPAVVATPLSHKGELRAELWKARPLEKTRRGSLSLTVSSLQGVLTFDTNGKGRDPRYWQKRACSLVVDAAGHHILSYTTKKSKHGICLESDVLRTERPASTPDAQVGDGSFDLVTRGGRTFSFSTTGTSRSAALAGALLTFSSPSRPREFLEQQQQPSDFSTREESRRREALYFSDFELNEESLPASRSKLDELLRAGGGGDDDRDADEDKTYSFTLSAPVRAAQRGASMKMDDLTFMCVPLSWTRFVPCHRNLVLWGSSSFYWASIANGTYVVDADRAMCNNAPVYARKACGVDPWTQVPIARVGLLREADGRWVVRVMKTVVMKTASSDEGRLSPVGLNWRFKARCIDDTAVAFADDVGAKITVEGGGTQTRDGVVVTRTPLVICLLVRSPLFTACSGMLMRQDGLVQRAIEEVLHHTIALQFSGAVLTSTEVANMIVERIESIGVPSVDLVVERTGDDELYDYEGGNKDDGLLDLPQNVIAALLSNVLEERSIALVSTSLHRCTSAVLLLKRCILPLVLQGPVLSILPDELHLILRAPTPVVVGLPMLTYSRKNLQRTCKKYKDVIFCDLNSKEILNVGANTSGASVVLRLLQAELAASGEEDACRLRPRHVRAAVAKLIQEALLEAEKSTHLEGEASFLMRIVNTMLWHQHRHGVADET